MKRVKKVKREDSIRSRERRRKPGLPHKLGSSIEYVVVRGLRAITVIHIHRMDA